MYDIITRLIGKKCEIHTVDDYFEGLLKEVTGNVAVVFDEFEEKDVYINLLQMISICESESDIKKEKPRKKGLFNRKTDLEDM
ncbi:MAG: hypothetical protein E7509_05835 [Ruminococcus sp.]|nr:hypothetical protein [Ruminococcus sp.]